ncbi:hypothetical protein EMIT0P171_10564 [Pseudomonas sp. IT-P171]
MRGLGFFSGGPPNDIGCCRRKRMTTGKRSATFGDACLNASKAMFVYRLEFLYGRVKTFMHTSGVEATKDVQ